MKDKQANLNRLLEIKCLQQLVQEKIDEHVFITYKQIWRLLTEEKLFFKGYRTFLRHIAEPQVSKRICNLIKEM